MPVISYTQTPVGKLINFISQNNTLNNAIASLPAPSKESFAPLFRRKTDMGSGCAMSSES